MVDTKQRTTLKKLARWSPSSTTSSRNQFVQPLSPEAPFSNVPHDKLQQGGLYILKIKQVSLALFEGWDDDMCCFSILRSEVEPMRWSEARQLPGDFDIFDAFDECGNPPIHLWSRYLRVNVPTNWFAMFEEAKRRQRDWAIQQHQFRQSIIQPSPDEHYYNAPPLPLSQQQQQDDVVHNSSVYSNTDVSFMQLNPSSVTSPSLIASSNIIDPSILQEQSLHGQSSNQSPVGNKESLRRRIVPVTLTDAKKSPSLKHHRSKEYVAHLNEPMNNDVSPSSTPIITTPPDVTESNFSAADLNFPHDSDKFSIRSTYVPSTPKPLEKQERRKSIKKMVLQPFI